MGDSEEDSRILMMMGLFLSIAGRSSMTRMLLLSWSAWYSNKRLVRTMVPSFLFCSLELIVWDRDYRF